MNVHITTADPIGLGSLDGSSGINIKGVSGGPVRNYLESIAGNGKPISAAVKSLKPIEEYTIEYELLDGASFTLAFGVAVNTNYLVTAFNANCGAEVRPTCSVTVIKPSAANLIKAYAGTACSITIAGGMGIVEKWGATAAGSFVTSQCSISMQTLEAMNETSGDYDVGGIYQYAFKKECTVEAYGAITLPTSYLTAETKREGADQIQIFAKSFWSYMDPA